MHIIMIAAENAALSGGKAGGIGDVIRDVPLALARQGHQVSVLTPGYQQLTHLNPASRIGGIRTVFAGKPELLELFRVQPAHNDNALVNHYVLDHPLFASCGPGQIYCHDTHAPFATDAHKFALFCTGAAQWLISDLLHQPDVIHLHDWHAALLAVLRRFHPRYSALKSIRTVYSIHNLSLQGIRPLRAEQSSLEGWHPELMRDDLWRREPGLQSIVDPRYDGCINLMRCGLLLSDCTHAVSPTYAQEIQRPSEPERGFTGGEGLERDLQTLAQQQRLIGILNGCEYPAAHNPAPGLAKADERRRLLQLIRDTLNVWATKQWSSGQGQIQASLFYALQRVDEWQKRRKPAAVSLLSIGRLTDQKLSLLRQPLTHTSGDVAVLDRILNDLGDGLYILVGTGDPALERFFTQAMQKHQNFLFLQGFSEPLADALYGAADLFLMPSSYEPCGISQMLAMRAGTPCIVHQVGGLRDTVRDGYNGFGFAGNSVPEQCEQLIDCVAQACSIVRDNAEDWAMIRQQAAATRFLWDGVIQDYIRKLYAS